MKRISASFVALGFAALPLVLLAVGNPGCGPSDETPATGRLPGQPPAPPANAPAADASMRTVFAVRKLFLGDIDRTGKSDANAWKKFGYNLDGKVTKSGAKDVCAPAGAGPVVDGDDGIDNAFGSRVISTLSSFLPNPSKTANDSIEAGTYTFLLDIRGLEDNPKQTNTKVASQFFGALGFGMGNADLKPRWDGTDSWPVSGDFLVDPKNPAAGSKLSFADGYVVDGLWVSGKAGNLVLSIAIGGSTVPLRMQNAFLTARRSGTNLVEGTVAGVIPTQELISALGKVAGSINPQACPGTPLFDIVANTLKTAADSRLDGVLGGECDAISMGIGFEAVVAQAPSKLAESPAVPPPDPCTNPPTDGGAPKDASADAAVDGSVDASADASPDATDTTDATDATDAKPDASSDSGVDGGSDGESDAGSDTTTDAESQDSSMTDGDTPG